MTSANATPTRAAFGAVIEDVIEVLWAPATVFDRAGNRGFGRYMLVTALLAAVVVAVTAPLVRPWLDATFELQMQVVARSGRTVPAAAMETGRRLAGIGYYLSPVLVNVLAPLLGGLLLLLAGRLLEAHVRYGQAVLIATLAGVPRVLSLVASGVLALVANADSARSLYDLSIGPARFVDPQATSPVLLQLLAGFDVFSLWQLTIFGVGMGVVARVSRVSGLLAGFVAWALGLGLPLALTLLRS